MAKAKSTAAKKLVIVESPTKAKTIRKFLGDDYIIESCMGHVRDLPRTAKDIPEKIKKEKWAHLGVDVDHDFEPVYTIAKEKTKVIKTLKDRMEEATELYLATDEDREGESISWHLIETLKPKIPVKRMVFNEITKSAILAALKDTRAIDTNLVHAQEARRILDRLVGYTISPLLWKKVAYGLSAGRVQSVAVRLIVEREHERLKFRRAEYWDIEADHESGSEFGAIKFQSRLISVGGERVATGKDFNADTGKLISGKTTAGETIIALGAKDVEAIKKRLTGKDFKVTDREEKPVSRKPAAPFITSTLQQEANRKLGLSAREAMQVAQGLYEKGFITYMRTDSTFLSTQALDAARDRIKKLYGKEYLPPEPRLYEGKKVKGAQEAHEAIRPSGTDMTPPEETGLTGMPLKLYELIWKRTMASQMVNSQQRQMVLRFAADNTVFNANGMTTDFPGFLRVYIESAVEDREDDDKDRNGAAEDSEVKLPALKVGDVVKALDLHPREHETKPPARFTEASLVQTMEREGIGRPSTYASIIGTIQDRGYVRKAGNALQPTFTAMVVARLLSKHLPKYVDLGFTSQMEDSLDEIAGGELDHLSYLKSVYLGKEGLRSQVEKQDKEIKPEDARTVILEGLKGLDFRVGRYGAYVCRTEKGGEEACASIPESHSPADMTVELANKLIDQKLKGTDALGKHPESGLPIYALTGRYGPYVQLGDATDEEVKPKRVSIPPTMSLDTLTFAQAMELISLPKTLGQNPGTGKDIKLGIGRFGPYVVSDGDFRSVPKTEDFLKTTFERALELFAKPKTGRGRAAAIRELGKIDGWPDPVSIFNGKYGPYLKSGKTNASIPDALKPETITPAQALELLQARAGTESEKPAKGGAKKKAAKSKAAPKAKAVAVKAAAVEASPATKTTKKVAAPKKKK